MSAPETHRPAPNTPHVNYRFVACLSLVILVGPLAILAVGVGALLGMGVAVIGWGAAALGVGAGAGAAIGVLLLGAWFVVFVIFAREPRRNPEGEGRR